MRATGCMSAKVYLQGEAAAATKAAAHNIHQQPPQTKNGRRENMLVRVKSLSAIMQVKRPKGSCIMQADACTQAGQPTAGGDAVCKHMVM